MAIEIPKTQIGDEIRAMTADEIVALELVDKEVEIRREKDAERQNLRTTALAKLGLTDEEISALLS